MHTLALQTFGHHVQIFGVAKAHDQHRRTAGQMRHRRLHRVRVFAHHIGRQVRRKNFITAVHPLHAVGQGAQHIDQSAAHMPTTKQGHGLRLRTQTLGQCWRVCRADALELEMHHTTAALPQGRAQRVACGECVVFVGAVISGRPQQQSTRFGHGLKL